MSVDQNKENEMERRTGEQVEAYAAERPVYDEYAAFLADLLSLVMRKMKIAAIVAARGKEIKSFAEKIIRKADQYPAPLYQFDDLCGARVIVNFANEIDPVCRFIRHYFDIDEANSEDVADRLGVSQFGYRGIHFTVSLNEGKLDRLFQDLGLDSADARLKKPDKRLYQYISPEICRRYSLSPKPRYRAEIQVRTLLQHAWADCAHDRVYKSDFAVPPSLIRDTNRIAASLENADNEFVRAIAGIEEYYTDYGAYMSREKMEAERQKLERLRPYDQQNLSLVCQIAQYSKLMEDYPTARECLEPFIRKWEETPSGELVLQKGATVMEVTEATAVKPGDDEFNLFSDPDLARALVLYGQCACREDTEAGLRYVQAAIVLNPTTADPWGALARIYQDRNESEKAQQCFERAYSLAPADPGAISGLVVSRIIEERNIDIVALIRPSLRVAIKTCRERIEAKVYIPQAFYDIGFFNLLLERPYESLNAYAAAILRSHAASEIERNRDNLVSVKKALKNRMPEAFGQYFKWAEMLLELAGKAKGMQGGALGKCTPGKRPADKPPLDPDTPVILVAGGCDPQYEEKITAEYKDLLHTAFNGFNGAIFCGCTKSGICGLIGDLPNKNKFAYFPQTIPAWTEKHPGYQLIFTTGHGFSALESIQNWIDLLDVGIDPASVKLLGINGGNISSFEFRLATALGAQVGIIRESGRAAKAIFDDPDWNNAEIKNLLMLPKDSTTVKLFVQGFTPPSMLPEVLCEKMAEDAHITYKEKRKAQFSTTEDPALLDWKDLPVDLKNSNIQQIHHIEEKMRAIGCGIGKIEDLAEIPETELTDEEIECLAEMEHGRWNAERLQAGWRPGPRDAIKKTSPYLVSWAELPDNIREYDREAVREIPNLLKQYGYRIYRLTDRTGQA